MKQTKDQIDNFINKWKNIVDRVAADQYTTYGGIKDYSAAKKLDKHPCYELWDKLIVLCNGDVTVCCLDFNGVLKIGNMKKDTLKGLWNGPKLKEMRKIHYNRDFSKIPLCERCDALYYKQS